MRAVEQDAPEAWIVDRLEASRPARRRKATPDRAVGNLQPVQLGHRVEHRERDGSVGRLVRAEEPDPQCVQLAGRRVGVEDEPVPAL